MRMRTLPGNYAGLWPAWASLVRSTVPAGDLGGILNRRGEKKAPAAALGERAAHAGWNLASAGTSERKRRKAAARKY